RLRRGGDPRQRLPGEGRGVLPRLPRRAARRGRAARRRGGRGGRRRARGRGGRWTCARGSASATAPARACTTSSGLGSGERAGVLGAGQRCPVSPRTAVSPKPTAAG